MSTKNRRGARGTGRGRRNPHTPIELDEDDLRHQEDAVADGRNNPEDTEEES